MSPYHLPPGAHPRGGEVGHVDEGTADGHRHRRLWLPVIALAAAGLSLAACSGGSHDAESTTTTTTAPVSALAQARQFTACMRSHGVTDFPEPTDHNGQISFSGGPPGLGRTPDFPSAQQTCSEAIYHTAPTGGNNAG